MKKLDTFQKLSHFLMVKLKDLNIKVLSFDVFDTLLLRRAHPDIVIRGVSSEMTKLMKQENILISKDPFATRTQAYLNLSENCDEKNLDQDTTLDQLIPAWISLMTEGNKDFIEKYQQHIYNLELEYEYQFTFPNRLILNTLKELKKQGRRIVFCSDMYLGKKNIFDLLNRHGFIDVFDEGYVSGDYQKLKRTGKLFSEVIKSEECEPGEILHIGDDPTADGAQAVKYGITSCLIRDKKQMNKKNKYYYDYERAKHDANWMGVMIAQYAQGNQETKIAYEEAYSQRLMGPFYAHLIHKLLDRCVEENINQVYFIARDGFLLKKIFDQFVEARYGKFLGPQSIYLCVSRLSTLLACSSSYGFREMTIAISNTGEITLKTLFAPFLIPEKLLKDVAFFHGVDDINLILPHFFHDWPILQRIVNDSRIVQYMSKKSKKEKDLLEQFLIQNNFFNHQKVAFVDIGWNGQIQDNIYEAFKEHKNCPDLYGFYLGVRLQAKWKESVHNRFEALVADETKLSWHKNIPFHFVQVFEAISRGFHGTVMGYEKSDTGVNPVFKSDQNLSRLEEKQDDRLLCLLQKGILNYCDSYQSMYQIYQFKASQTSQYAYAALERVLRFPKPKEASWLLSLKNVSDLGLSDVYTMGYDISDLPLHKRWKLFRRVIQHSFWHHGTITLLKNCVLSTYYNFRYILSTTPKIWVPLESFLPRINDCKEKVEHISSNKIVNDKKCHLTFNESHIAFNLLCQNADRFSKLENHDHQTQIITIKEVFSSNVMRHIINIICKATKRHVYTHHGLSYKDLWNRYRYHLKD